jgi:hypothetical protein
MNSRLSRVRPLLLVLAVALAINNAWAKEVSGPRIYSDVRVVEEGRDLAGTELELKIEGSVATGVLRIYDGRCAEPVPVAGSFSGNTIHVSGEGQGFGKIEITGSVHSGRLGQGDHFDGTLRLERNHTTEKIRLKRITKPHC